MSDIREAQRALVRRILEGAGTSSSSDRKAAFSLSALRGPVSALVEKVAHQASRIIDEDIAVVKAAGMSEDQVFEIVVCAAIGQASRQYHAGHAALEAASGKV